MVFKNSMKNQLPKTEIVYTLKLLGKGLERIFPTYDFSLIISEKLTDQVVGFISSNNIDLSLIFYQIDLYMQELNRQTNRRNGNA